MYKKYNRLKKLKVRIIKKKKEEKMEENRQNEKKKKGKLQRTAKAQHRSRSL